MAAYPAHFQCAQITPYSLAVDMGVLRSAQGGAAAAQRRLYRTMPTIFSLDFVMTVQELGEWQAWVNEHAYDYFVIDALESMSSGAKGRIAAPHVIRFISNLAIDNPVYGWVRVKVQAELGGVASYPELAWIIAGTPAFPSTGQAPLAFDFMVPGTLPAGATLARAGVANYTDAAGAHAQANTNVPRWTYDATTLALLGLLNEPAATNSNPNAAGAGVVPGSPGTAPSGWTISGSINGLVRTIGAGGTDNGMPYFTVRYAGTPLATSSHTAQASLSNVVPALPGQTWQTSWNVGLEPGSSLANVTMRIETTERDAALAPLMTTNQPIVPTTARLPTQRGQFQRLLNQPTTIWASSALRWSCTINQAIDVTLRIALPQLVQAPAQMTLIATTAGAVTRAGDVVSVALTDGTYDLSTVRAAGTTPTLGQAVAGGAWIVPTDPSPLQSISATKTGPPVWIIGGSPAAPAPDLIEGGTPPTWNL